MTSSASIRSAESATETTLEQIIDSIQEAKGKNIAKLDLRQLDDAPTDFFVICEGSSTTQIKAIADRIERDLKTNLSERPAHVEGSRNAQWICLDYFNTIVHVFHPELRAFYDLEDLWSDAEVTQYETL
ncbi:MAG: ribosome silencing factor [Bacteroidota bacterium]